MLAPIASIVVTWIVGIYVALVLESPYWNDDTVDENLRGMLKASHTALLPFIGKQISAFVSGDARFDPGTLAWTYSSFYVFDNRGSYKLVIGLLLVLAILTTSMCVAAMARSWVPAGLLVLIVSGTLQVRFWADGITSFAGLMSLTTALTFGALLLLLTKRGRMWTVLAALLYLAALFTYEYVFAFAPAMIAIIIFVRRDWRPAIAVAVPAALTLVVSALLHLLVNAHPVPEYTLSLSPTALPTFVKQLVAALPLSQWWLGHTAGLAPIAGTLILVSTVLIGLPVFLTVYYLGETPRYSRRAAQLCGLLGASMWIAPAILVGVTKRWQESMPWGQGYIPVVYEYFGLALCLLSLWMLVGRKLHAGQHERGRLAWRLGSAGMFALLSTLTMAANLSLMP